VGLRDEHQSIRRRLATLIGFLPRLGVRRTSASCNFQPRPSKDGPFAWIRQEFFENDYVRYTDPKGIVESWEYFMAPVNVRFETGDRFEFNWNPHGETLIVPFELPRRGNSSWFLRIHALATRSTDR